MEGQNMENNNFETETNVEKGIEIEKEEVKVDKNKLKTLVAVNVRKLILKIVLVLFVALIVFLLYKKVTYKEKIDLKSIPTVNVTHIKIGQIAKDITVNGEIKPSDIYYVVSKVGGDIKKIYVENGDHVKKGDPICDIDASKEIEAAFIEYDTAKKNYERMQKLFMAGDISQQNFEQVKAAYDGKKLAYDTKVEYSTVVAVDDGIIENTDMIINTAISSGKILCYITSNEAKEIDFGVTERVLSGVSMGEKVIIEKAGMKYEGKVSNISKLISNDGLFHIKAVILTKNNFAAGVNASVTFEYDRKVNTQILPNDVIYYESGQAYVFVVDEKNITRKKYIEVGMENKDTTEITTKLDKKEKIVSTWNKDLAEGSPIKIGIDEEVIDDIVKDENDVIKNGSKKEMTKEPIKATFSVSNKENSDINENNDRDLSKVNSVIDELGEKLGITKSDENDVFTDNKNTESSINENQVNENSTSETTMGTNEVNVIVEDYEEDIVIEDEQGNIIVGKSDIVTIDSETNSSTDENDNNENKEETDVANSEEKSEIIIESASVTEAE